LEAKRPAALSAPDDGAQGTKQMRQDLSVA
jgi:hypothetical protein